MGVSAQPHGAEVAQGGAGTGIPDDAKPRQAPQHRRYLEVDQVRRVESLPGAEYGQRRGARDGCPQEDFHQDRGINDDQRLSRSSRSTSAGLIVRFTGSRVLTMASHSCIVG